MPNATTHIDIHSELDKYFRIYYQPLCYYASHLLHSDTESQDVVQDVFIKLIKTGKQFDNDRHLLSYLYIAVHNACFDLSKKGPQHPLTSLDIEKTNPSQEEDAELLIVRTELTRYISEAIGNLSPRYQQVIKLTYLEGKSNEETAEAMGISINTVKVMKKRAKLQLKERLKDIYPLFLLLIKYI